MSKIDALTLGLYNVPVPPVPHTGWSVWNWIDYIDRHNGWTVPVTDCVNCAD